MSKIPETLTLKESESLLHFLWNTDKIGFKSWRADRNYTIALLMLDAGLRVGEVCRLTPGDLLFNGVPIDSLNVSHEIAEKKCDRLIPLSGRLKDAIQKMQIGIWNHFKDPPPKFAFFDWNINKSITARQIQRIVENASEKSIGRKIHPHVLRHTFGTRLMRITNIRTVQQLLGHKRLSSTEIYTHPNGDDSKKAIDKISSCEKTC